MRTTLAPARLATCLLTGCIGISAAIATGVIRAEPGGPNRPAAELAVGEALQREIYGLPGERQRLLQIAAALAPQYAPAQWHRGMVKGPGKTWLSAEDFVQQWTSSRRVKLYERARQEAADTVEGQLGLADYCRREGLPDQMRAALTRVIEMVPDHEAARRELGFVRRGPLWLNREQIESEEALAKAHQLSGAKWGKRLEEIARDLSSASRKQRESAGNRILALSDPEAIPALEQMISPLSDAAAKLVIDALALSPHPEASLSLARHAVYYPSLAVREQAADALADRDRYSFVPALLDLMVTPVQSRVAAGVLPAGRIGYRHAFLRQRQDRQELLILDTEYMRVALEGGSRGESRDVALAALRSTALARELETVRQNELTVRLNERVAWVLNRVTGEELPAAAETWWKWWDQVNQTERPGPKPQVANRQFRREQIVDQVPQLGGDEQEQPEESSRGRPRKEAERPQKTGPKFLLGWELKFGRMVNPGSDVHCLVAGTLVWTASGPRAIEQIQRGDLVLSQDVDSGELAFKPVLRTVQTKRGPTVEFTAGFESIGCSGGHVFWVSGDGWKQASELETGMLLHSVAGGVPVRSVSAGAEAPTYNLVVADFGTYFVGQQRILARDYTLRGATSAVIPGLKPE